MPSGQRSTTHNIINRATKQNELIGSRKKVKSSDHYICGNVMAEYKDKIIIIEGDTIKSHEYIIPKSRVDHYDENDLYLNISRHDMTLNFEF